MDLAMVQRLSSGEGWGLLQSLPPYDETDVLGLQQRLRGEGFDADLVAAALTQSRLRARGAEKFGEFAEDMLFTADGLEQATRLPVAAQHARHFREAGLERVHDLGCGIGADAMAMSAAGRIVHAVDADAVTAAVAKANLRFWPASSALLGFAEEFTPPTGPARETTGVWLDPARRTPGRADITGRTKRIFDLASISPSWSFVREVAAAVPATGVKLSPAFPHNAIPPGTEAQWVSYAGEVLECALWWGPLAEHPGRSALVLFPDRLPEMVLESEADAATLPVDTLDALGDWLYEPDRAVIRAGLTGVVSRVAAGRELDTGVGYVSAERSVEVRFARRYAVLEAMPFNIKALRSWLRDHGVSRLTIKKRGVSIDPDQLRCQLRLPAKGRDEETVIVLTRVRGNPVVLVVRPA